jgi:hypothetical protein
LQFVDIDDDVRLQNRQTWGENSFVIVLGACSGDEAQVSDVDSIIAVSWLLAKLGAKRCIPVVVVVVVVVAVVVAPIIEVFVECFRGVLKNQAKWKLGLLVFSVCVLI